MIRPRNGLIALGLCGILLGVVVFGTSGVQAENGAHWNVNGVSISATLLPEIQVTEVELKSMTLLTKISGNKFDLSCAKAQFVGAKLGAEGTVPSNKIKFSECIAKVNGTISSACEPHTGAEKGTVTTNSVKGLIILHEGLGIIRFEPFEGEKFMTFETSEKCSIGEKIPLIGKLTMKDCTNELGVEKVTHLIQEGPLSEVWIISKTVEHLAKIDGSAILQLSGAHAGLPWSGTPA